MLSSAICAAIWCYLGVKDAVLTHSTIYTSSADLPRLLVPSSPTTSVNGNQAPSGHKQAIGWPPAGLPRRPLVGKNLGMTLRTTVSMPAEVKHIQAEHGHIAAERRYTGRTHSRFPSSA